jgi:hypothetical protein
MGFDVGRRIRAQLLESQVAEAELKSHHPLVHYSRQNFAHSCEQVSARIQGVHELEWIDGKPCFWSNGHVRLDCVFSRPHKIAWCSMVVDAGPIPKEFSIGINQFQPITLRTRHRRTVLLQFRKPVSTSCMVLRIDSPTFVPSLLIEGNSDERELGVMIQEVYFAKHLWRLPLNRFGARSKFRRV